MSESQAGSDQVSPFFKLFLATLLLAHIVTYGWAWCMIVEQPKNAFNAPQVVEQNSTVHPSAPANPAPLPRAVQAPTPKTTTKPVPQQLNSAIDLNERSESALADAVSRGLVATRESSVRNGADLQAWLDQWFPMGPDIHPEEEWANQLVQNTIRVAVLTHTLAGALYLSEPAFDKNDEEIVVDANDTGGQQR